MLAPQPMRSCVDLFGAPLPGATNPAELTTSLFTSNEDSCKHHTVFAIPRYNGRAARAAGPEPYTMVSG